MTGLVRAQSERKPLLKYAWQRSGRGRLSRDRQHLDALDQTFDRDRIAGGEETVGGILGGAVDDDLAMVRLAKPLVAGLMTGDEPVGVDHRGVAVDRLGLGVASP